MIITITSYLFSVLCTYMHIYKGATGAFQQVQDINNWFNVCQHEHSRAVVGEL